MTKQAKRSETSKRGAVLAAVEPEQVRAMVTMQETDPETLAAMVTMVNVMTRGDSDGGDVAALAVVTAPSLWLGRRTPTMPPVAVAAVAVRKARRTLSGLAREAREAVAAGDVLVEAVEAGDVPLSMGRQWCPSPEARWMTGWGDALAAMVATVADETARTWLGEAVAAWVAVEAAGPRMGAPVSLAGAIGVEKGWKSSGAAGKAASRAVLAALAALPVETVEAVLQTMDVRPGEAVPHGSNRLTGAAMGTGRHVAEAWETVVRSIVLRDGLGYVAALGYGTDALGYGAALGYDDGCHVEDRVRAMAPGERSRVEDPSMGAPDRVTSGESNASRADDRERALPEDWETFGHRQPLPGGRSVTPGSPVRSGKVEPSPRKRPGSGATGPTTTAW